MGRSPPGPPVIRTIHQSAMAQSGHCCQCRCPVSVQVPSIDKRWASTSLNAVACWARVDAIPIRLWSLISSRTFPPKHLASVVDCILVSTRVILRTACPWSNFPPVGVCPLPHDRTHHDVVASFARTTPYVQTVKFGMCVLYVCWFHPQYSRIGSSAMTTEKES